MQEAASACKICNEGGECSCSSNLSRYVSLLMRAQARVSTLKLTSDIEHPSPRFALDKLTFQLASPIPQGVVMERLAEAGILSHPTKLRDRRWHLRLGMEGTGSYFPLGNRNAPVTYGLMTRPSAFQDFAAYRAHLKQFLTNDEIQDMRISRMDLALDYELRLTDFLRGFDFKAKRLRHSYQDEGARRTGVTLGTGAERIQVYDKALESGIPSSPLTRLELQISGSKVPCRDLGSLGSTLVGNWNPFTMVSLNEVEVCDPLHVDPDQHQRISTLSTLLEREGLFSAKRALNEHGNFARDYGPLLRVRPWPEQPAESFKKQVEPFLNSQLEAV